ncbi:GIY-YIG nuclease family protein [Rummeliibacillus suwonensis]|uniref:GIY-YIG nuclease family protein n=1 Tax=Rummeliibacillus suwonensis TaxID=1306154 RepID=UPI001AAF05BC|nr:GIY-YIG nuclease family protein [Rummeliibacillus suwonensis]MBO2535088.1 GIY-YIG nuclease family protein [Rummeliibacillus suwonensis]
MNITKLDINLNRQITLFEGKHKNNKDEKSFLLEAIHDYIVKNKSIQGIDIEIPTMDFSGDIIEFFNEAKRYKVSGGIYFLFSEDRRILNIGSTTDLFGRIYQKLMGKNGGSKADYYFSGYYAYVSFFNENNYLKRRVYEPFLINKHQPPLNYQYNYYNKKIYYEILKKAEEASQSSIYGLFGYKGPHDY